MRSIVLALIILLALFTILRAYTGEPHREARPAVPAGVVELPGGQDGARLAF